MSWYDNGIQGKNSAYMVTSRGVEFPITNEANLIGYINAGSYSLNTSPTEGETTSTLLLTTTGGTQIFIEKKATFQSGIQYYTPTEIGNRWQYQTRIALKKGNSLWAVDYWYSGAATSFIAGEGSIYNYNYRRSPDGFKWGYPTDCMPASLSSGGATNQVAVVKSTYGLDFYNVGFPWPNNPTQYPRPCTMLGRIPNDILMSEFWFDPVTDSIDDSELPDPGGDTFPDPDIDYDYDGDDIGFPELPNGASVLGFGRMNIFHPTTSALAKALDILWSMADLSSITDLLDTIKDVIVKIIYKPEQYCVSLMLMPINVSGDQKKIYFGKYDTLALAPAISSQWQIVDCGSINVPLKSGSAFDYAPHVKVMLFIPYVGFRAVNVNELMGGSVHIKYYVDMFTGSALCFVRINNSLSNNSVLYTYECNIAQQVPITSTNYNGIISTLLAASSQVISGNIGGAVTAAAGGMNNFTPDIQTSGQLNANTGALGNEKPFIVLHFPVQSVPTGFVNQNGYPSSINIMLGNISGYTEVEKIHLNITGAYREDLEDIERLLNEGVIL